MKNIKLIKSLALSLFFLSTTQASELKQNPPSFSNKDAKTEKNLKDLWDEKSPSKSWDKQQNSSKWQDKSFKKLNEVCGGGDC